MKARDVIFPARKVKRVLCGLFLQVICVMAVSAMDWPAADAALVRNFGWNDRGKPVLGSVFQGEQPALAAENGELIFFRREGDTVSRLPSPLGVWAALDHGDGLISIYSRFEAGEESPPLFAEQNEPIAKAGISGWSSAKGFYFVLYDRRERRWVNPSMIITPLPDTRPPEILSVELRNLRGGQLIAAGARSLAQGRYAIVVSARDTRLSPRELPLAPHRIICSINGTEAGSLNFETIAARDGTLLVNLGTQADVRQIYAPFPAFEAGEALLSSGQATLEVIAQDAAGNSRRFSRRMQIE